MSIDIAILVFLSFVAIVPAVIFAFREFNEIKNLPEGNDSMKFVSGLIREGAESYLSQQFKSIFPFIILFASALWLLFGIQVNFYTGAFTAFGYLVGAFSSLLCGWIGMRAATFSNVRVAAQAVEKRSDLALKIAFRGGSIMGLMVGASGVFFLALLFAFFGDIINHEPLIGFGFGASSISLFARIGGGIYTKAADVGSDLVGKVEAGIPEDDPRNPGVIADNVGDNVGDIGGMGADIYESFVAIVIGCLALGATMAAASVQGITNFKSVDEADLNYYQLLLMMWPIFQGAVGVLAGTLAIKMFDIYQDFDPAVSLRRSIVWSVLLFWLISLPWYFLYGVDVELWICVVLGTLGGLAVGFFTDYYTSKKPILSIVQASKTGPATNIISGFAVGLKSVLPPVFALGIVTFLAIWIGGIYGSALAGVGMLSLVVIIMTVDAFGPIADNAGGIVELSKAGEEARKITDKLDSVGNTTAALGKGFAIGASALTAVSLFYAYIETVLLKGANLDINFSIMNHRFLIGTLIGAVIPAFVAALTMESVGRAASKIVEEIRRQFREIPGLLEGREGVKPDVNACISISTKSALSEMKAPGLIAVVSPFLVRYLIGLDGLAGYVLGVILVGIVLGIAMANSGGAWDNAKKAIEQGLIEGEKKGSDSHKAAVVGDTVGDPFKDTSGPALNILIKIVSVVSLLIASLG